jgi:hypothetical protein
LFEGGEIKDGMRVDDRETIGAGNFEAPEMDGRGVIASMESNLRRADG